jgi:hypothetical protein
MKRTALLILGHLWALPWTLVALVLAGIGWTAWAGFDPDNYWHLRFAAKPSGLLRWCMRRFGWAGITLGAVVVYQDEELAQHPDLRRHEGVHVWQGMINGPFQPVLYLIASYVAWLTGQGEYRGNDFEEHARGE